MSAALLTTVELPRSEQSVNGLARFFLLLAICTSSIEILLTLNIGGFNARPIYIYVLIASLCVLYSSIRTNKIFLPFAFLWPVLWVALNIAYLPNSIILVRGLLYVAVLLVSLLMLFCVAQAFRTPEQIKSLVRWYLVSFVVHAGLGLCQWFLVKVAGIDTLIDQGNQSRPRINGLTHEPSSFAAYEIFGYVLLRELIRRRSEIFRRTVLFAMFSTIALALVLSTSKTALLLILIYEAFISAKFILTAAKRGKVSIAATAAFFIGIGFIVVFISYIFLNLDSDSVQLLLSGSGIGGTAGHSFDDRFERSFLTVIAAIQHPIIGTSYGGAAAYLAEMAFGSAPKSGKAEDLLIPLFTPAEIVLATGLPGLLVVIVYIFKLMRASLRFDPSSAGKIRAALAWSFIFGLSATESDFTRAIIWAHFAVWSAVMVKDFQLSPRHPNLQLHDAGSRVPLLIAGQS